jgi:hypothetical protein
VIPCIGFIALSFQSASEQHAGFTIPRVFIQTMGAQQRGPGTLLRQRPVSSVKRQRAEGNIIAIILWIKR